MSVETGVPPLDLEAAGSEYVRTMTEMVRAREWEPTHELLATIADRLGVTASGRQYQDAVPRIRRPYEPDPNAPITFGQFARRMMGGGM